MAGDVGCDPGEKFWPVASLHPTRVHRPSWLRLFVQRPVCTPKSWKIMKNHEKDPQNHEKSWKNHENLGKIKGIKKIRRNHMICFCHPWQKAMPAWGRKVIQNLDGRAWRARTAFRGSAGLASWETGNPGKPLYCNMYKDYKKYPNLPKLPDNLELSLEKLKNSKQINKSFGEKTINR